MTDFSKSKPGDLADQLLMLRIARLQLKRDVNGIKQTEREIKDWLLKAMPKEALSRLAGKLAQVSISSKIVPQAEDWPAFYKYLNKHHSYEMLQKRLSPEPFRERWEMGLKVSGIVQFTVIDLSVTKLHKGE